MLFCDLVGFTSASEQADVEDVQRRLAAYHDRVRERVEAFGGVVEKFVGDAVMAVFGAPIAHEDDAERAVRAGLSIVEEVATLPDTRVRVGINTGEALVAVGARPEAGESYVVGDVVNTAARLQTAAPVDCVVVGEVTYRATDRVFEYAELIAIEAKGKSEPVSLWQALAAKARFGTDLMRDLDTPMVGRSLELATLSNAFERARAGGAQLVTLVGEAGVGKSRLVAELFALTDRLPELVVWRQGRCLPYGDGIAYWALAEVVKAHLGIYDGDQDDQVRAKLDRLTEAGTDPWVVSALASLLGLGEGDPNDRDGMFEAWRQFLDGLTEEQPAVLVMEDLHWADPALLDFLEYLVDWSQTARLLVVATARPDLLAQRGAWGAGLTNAATVRLSPLSATETSELIVSRLGTSELPLDVRTAVVERSGGNPLYAEEFVRMLRDRAIDPSSLDPQSLALPESVHALIAARLDTLPGRAKEVLQYASVVGKVFWAGAVAALSEADRSEVESVLHDLSRKEMVRPMRRSSLPGDVEYAFTHALIRDVAYQQLTREARAVRHLAAAKWLEGTSGERVGEVSEVLVYHATSALELARVAGDVALEAGALPVVRRACVHAALHLRGLDQMRAQSYADRALELVDDATPPADEAEVIETWGDLAVQVRPVHEVLERIDRAVELRRSVGAPQPLADALILAETWARNGNQVERANRHRVELQGLLDQLVDPYRRVEALADIAQAIGFQGDQERALAMSAEAVDAVTVLGEPRRPADANAWIGAHNVRGTTLLRAGQPGAVQHFDEAIRVSKTWRPHRALYIGNNRATALCAAEGLAEGLAAFDDTIATCRERGLVHSVVWVQSASLIFRLANGQLHDTYERAVSGRDELESLGSLVETESRSVLISVAAELGRSAEVAHHGERLVGEVWHELRDFTGDTDTRLILVVGALDHLLQTGQREEGERMLRRFASSPVDNYEMAGRASRFVRQVASLGALDVLGGWLATTSRRLPLVAAGCEFGEAVVLSEGQPEAGATALAAAATALSDVGAHLDAAYATAGAGRAWLRVGSPEAATQGTQLLERAAAEFDRMGALPAADACRESGPDGI